MIKLIVENSRENTLYAMQGAIHVLKVEDGVGVKGPMRAIMAMFTTDDGLDKWRVEKFFPAIMNELLDDHKFLNATDVAMVMLLRMMKRSPLVRNTIAAHTKQYGWIVEYMTCRMEGKTIPNSVVFKSKAANASHHAAVYVSSPSTDSLKRLS